MTKAFPGSSPSVHLFPAVFAFLLPMLFADDPPEIPPSEGHRYIVMEGTIGDKLEVRMSLFQTASAGYKGNEQDAYSGWYEYKHIKEPVRLWGDTWKGMLVMEERPNEYSLAEEEITGSFQGRLEAGEEGGEMKYRYEGTWKSPDGTKALPFVLEERYAPGIIAADYYHFSESLERRRGEVPLRRSAEVTFPQLKGEGEGIAKVNGELRSMAHTDYEALQGIPSLQEVERSVKAPPIGEEGVDWYGFTNAEIYSTEARISYNVKNLISVRFYFDSYTGGAHGNQTDTYATYDLLTGEVLSLDDLLKPGFSGKLIALAEAALRREYDLEEDQPLSDGPLFSNEFQLNDNWFLVPEGLGFSYVPYEIGPYAAGFIRPVVPFFELAPLLREDSPLLRASSR